MWVRDAMHSKDAVDSESTPAGIVIRTLPLVEKFREDIYIALGASQSARARLSKPATSDHLCQSIDRWLLQRTRKQLAALAERWQEVYSAQRASDADLVAAMRGERYWGILPTPFTSTDGARRVVPLESQRQLTDFGAAMSNCLEASHLKAYHAACLSGTTFVVGVIEAESAMPRSTAEFRVVQPRGGERVVVELVQHTAMRNSTPSVRCKAVMLELMSHLESDAIQRHIRVGVTAVHAIRRRSISAISDVEKLARQRALRQLLGDTKFEDLLKRCERPAGLM